MKQLLTIVLLVAGLPAVAQTSPGLYGKKLYVELAGQGSFTLFNMEPATSLYKAENGRLVEQAYPFSTGFTGTIGIAAKRNIGLSLEAGMRFDRMPAPLYLYVPAGDEMEYVNVRMEALRLRTFSVMPILEIGERDGLLPIGISHQIGVGHISTRIADRPYVVKADQETIYYDDPQTGAYTAADAQDYLDSLNIRGKLFDFSEKYTGVSFMYALKMRTAVSKTLMLNYGLRYTFSFISRPSAAAYNLSFDDELNNQVRRTRLRNFISLNFGVTLLL